jgi:hypothetical protein
MNPLTFKAFLQIKNISFCNQPIPVLHQNEPYLYLGVQLVPFLNWNVQTHFTLTKLIQQCKVLSNCLATIKQKLNMANIAIRPVISYSFYAVPYSMPTIRKLDKQIIALQKKICGLPICTPNITSQLPRDLFGMEVFSLKNAYLTCSGEQLRNVLNDTGRLGKIYVGLSNYILAKYGGALHLPRIRYSDCICSPTTRTLFLLKEDAQVHIRSTFLDFLLHPTPLETIWMDAIMDHPFLIPQRSLQLLHKLLLHHITDIKHFTLPNGTHLMSTQEFKLYFDTPTKLITTALDIAAQLFCHPSCLPQFRLPCPYHYLPRSLLPQYVTSNHNIHPRNLVPPFYPHPAFTHHIHCPLDMSSLIPSTSLYFPSLIIKITTYLTITKFQKIYFIFMSMALT